MKLSKTHASLSNSMQFGGTDDYANKAKNI